MSLAKKELKSARECLVKREYKEAVEHCKAVLREDKTCVDAFLYIGKATYGLKEYHQAEQAYNRAIDLNRENPQAWQGLAEVYTDTNDTAKLIPVLAELVKLSQSSEDEALQAKLPTFLRRLADAQAKLGQLADAEATWQWILNFAVTTKENLEYLCHLADVQLRQDQLELERRVQARLAEAAAEPGAQVLESVIRAQVEGEWADEALESETDHATDTLRQIIAQVPPSPPYAPYHDAYLARLRKAIYCAPQGSLDRHNRRVAVLQQCKSMIEGKVRDVIGGCCSPYAYVEALRMLEVEEEVAGATMPHSISRQNSSIMSGFSTPSGMPPRVQRSLSSISGYGTPALPRIDVRRSVTHSGYASPLIRSQGPSRILSPTHSGMMSPPSSPPPIQALFSPVSGQLAVVAGRLAPFMLEDTEHIALQLAHAFPWSPYASVHIAMALRRRVAYLSGPHAAKRQATMAANHAALNLLGAESNVTDLSCYTPKHQQLPTTCKTKRQNAVLKELGRGMKGGAVTVAGWIALAEMLMESGSPQAALEAAKQGLRYVAQRHVQGKERMVHAGYTLRLIVGKALMASGRLDDAETAFQQLANGVSEGEVAFMELAGSPAVSIRQQACRGMAQVAQARGDRKTARYRYEELVARAMMGKAPAEPWAYSEYGWLMFEDGDTRGAKHHLETALELVEKVEAGGGRYDEAERALMQLRLGRVYWHMGGVWKEDRQNAQTLFLSSASSEGSHQASAFAWLGHWCAQVGHDLPRAKKCYQRALALDPSEGEAGNALCELLGGMPNGAGLERALCEEVLTRQPDARWALRRLAGLQLAAGECDSAVQAYQRAISDDPKCAELWEGLAAAYHALARHSSAIKAYCRALELQGDRLYCLLQLAGLYCLMGSHKEAVARYKQALALAPEHPAALLGCAEALLATGHAHLRSGALGAASLELAQAAELAQRCTATRGGLATAWKLLGDIEVQHAWAAPAAGRRHLVAAAGEAAAAAAAPMDSVTVAVGARQVRLARASLAYRHALHHDPTAGAVWGDLAATLQQEAAQEPGSAPSLLPERLVRGGLRLEPASEWLWARLGAVAADVAVREAALGRALQLNPKKASAWVQLGRLYASAGQGPLADRCYESARSADPTLVAVWDAMGHLAALQGNQAGALDAWEHAVGLGGSPESRLGFATLALKRGRAGEGDVLASASTAATALPAVPAAHNALGLAAEAHGLMELSIRSFRFALELIKQGPAPDGHSTTQLDGRTAASEQLHTAVRLNLARALVHSGQAAEAVAEYEQLKGLGAMSEDGAAWLCYADALQQVQQPQQAADALAVAEQLAGSDQAVAGKVAVAALRLALNQGHLAAAAELVHRHAAAGSLVPDCLAGMWLTLIAGYVVYNGALWPGELAAAFQQWLGAQHGLDQACWQAQLTSQKANALAAAEQGGAAVVAAASAVHTCPWDPRNRQCLAAQVLAHRPRDCRAAFSCCPQATWQQLAACEGTPSTSPAPAAAIRTVAALWQGANCPQADLLRELRELRAAVHARPDGVLQRYLLALTHFQLALTTGASALFRSCLLQCAAALRLVPLTTPGGGDDAQRLGVLRLQLMVVAAECKLRSRLPGCGEGALKLAEEAVAYAGVAGLPSCAAQRQVARALLLLARYEEAEQQYRTAMAQGDTLARLELAHMLHGRGSTAAAHQVLRAESNGSTHPGQPSMGTWDAALELEAAVLAAAVGELSQAKQAALVVADRARSAAGYAVAGWVCLKQAAGAAGDDRTAALQEARRWASAATRLEPQHSMAQLLLAYAAVGRGKEDAAGVALAQMGCGPDTSPGATAAVALIQSSLAGAGSRHAAHAVHAAPWMRLAWDSLPQGEPSS